MTKSLKEYCPKDCQLSVRKAIASIAGLFPVMQLHNPDSDPLPPLPAEQLVIEGLGRISVDKVGKALVISPGRAQSALAIREAQPTAKVTAWFVDSYRASRVSADSTINVACSPDLPDDRFDLIVLPVLRTGEAEMNRELIQQSYQRLQTGGHLIAAVNAPQDQWLHQQLKPFFDHVSCHTSEVGRTYIARRGSDLKRMRKFDCQITFPVDDRVLTTYSRPSVFSHRSVDMAARIMIREVDIPIGSNVVELGCGNGAVAIAAAHRTQTGQVYAIDSNTRAIECVQRAIDQQGITDLTAIVNHDGVLPQIAPCQIALLNPPYYGDFTIAKHFVTTATGLLAPGGHAWVITKDIDSYQQQEWPRMKWIGDRDVQGYQLITMEKF
jgi:16S rRNA G1207 methylase RsmC